MRPFAAALVLALVIVGAPLWGGARFFYRDVSRQYEPLAHQLSQAWGRGDAPLWNASTQGGVPLLANLHAGALAPHALLTATAPFHLGYAWAVALALTILGAGMFRLLRDFVGPRESAVGAAAVVLSGVMLGATSYLPFLAGLSLVPWQARLCRVERSRLVVPGLALLFAAQIFEGDPSTAVMGGLASLALTPRAALRVGASAGLGALVAMVQLGPAWDLFAVSSRAAGSAEAQLAWSLHPLRLVELVVRLPWGQLLQEPYFTRYELAAGPDAQPFLLDHGWGTVAVLLLPLGLVRRHPLRGPGLGLIALGLVLAMGKHFAGGALHALPPFSLFRFPERWDALTAFGMGLLVAAGLATWGADSPGPRRWGGWCLVVGLAAGVGAIASSAALRASLTVLALSALAVGLLAVAIPARRRVILAALLLVGLVDWGRARAASVMTLTHAPASNAQVDGLVLAGGGRVWRDNASLRAVERSGVRGPQGFADELDFLERTFASARPTLRGIDELGGYSPVALRDWQEVIRRFSGAPDVLFRMFNVCWIVSSSERVWTSRHGLEVAATLAPNVVLLRYHGCLPRAWVAPELEALPSRDAVLERMSRPDFEPAQTAVLEATAASRLRWQSGEARVTRPGAGELVVDVSGDGDRLVVIAETWAEGWQAEVDGAPADVLRVNGTLLGAHLGPGQHQLRLEYGEPALRWAVPVSAIALLLLGLARWRGRHRPSGDTP